MKGTEKQIQYVNDIITNLSNALEEAGADPQLAALPEAQRSELFERAAELIRILQVADYAGDVISVAAQAAKYHGQEAFAYLASSIRVSAHGKLVDALKSVISKPM